MRARWQQLRVPHVRRRRRAAHRGTAQAAPRAEARPAVDDRERVAVMVVGRSSRRVERLRVVAELQVGFMRPE